MNKQALRTLMVLGFLVALALVTSLPALAQSIISAQAGLVHYAEGNVYLGDTLIKPTFGQFPQIKENQDLRTEAGRAEVLLSPGVFLRVGENSSFRMLSTRLTDTKLELLSGNVIVEAAELRKDAAVTILYKDATVSLQKSGVYRLGTSPAELRVFDGEALVRQADHQIAVNKGKVLTLDGSLMARKFDRSLTDSMDRWSARRAQYLSMANMSSAYSLLSSGRPWLMGGWLWNPYFGMYSYIPYQGVYNDYYGYSFWSPRTVYTAYSQPSRSYGSSAGSYRTPSMTSSGTSGTVASVHSGSSSPVPSSPSPSSPASGGMSHTESGGGGHTR